MALHYLCAVLVLIRSTSVKFYFLYRGEEKRLNPYQIQYLARWHFKLVGIWKYCLDKSYKI